MHTDEDLPEYDSVSSQSCMTQRKSLVYSVSPIDFTDNGGGSHDVNSTISVPEKIHNWISSLFGSTPEHAYSSIPQHDVGEDDHKADRSTHPDGASTSHECSTSAVDPQCDDNNTNMSQGRSRPHDACEHGSILQQLRGDWFNVALLLLLYILQGLPIGISMTVPLVMQERNSGYAAQAVFSLVTLPFSFKILWAPLVDTYYNAQIGRRKTWILPTQLLCGIVLIAFATSLDTWIGTPPIAGNATHKDASHHHVHVNVFALSVYFIILYVLMATQDIAVDAWCLTMLRQRNINWAGTINNIGQYVGIYIAYISYLFLSSAEWCNQYLRSPANYSDQGVLDIVGLMQWCGILFLFSTSTIILFKKEQNYHELDILSDVYWQYKEYVAIQQPSGTHHKQQLQAEGPQQTRSSRHDNDPHTTQQPRRRCLYPFRLTRSRDECERILNLVPTLKTSRSPSSQGLAHTSQTGLWSIISDCIALSQLDVLPSPTTRAQQDSDDDDNGDGNAASQQDQQLSTSNNIRMLQELQSDPAQLPYPFNIIATEDPFPQLTDQQYYSSTARVNPFIPFPMTRDFTRIVENNGNNNSKLEQNNNNANTAADEPNAAQASTDDIEGSQEDEDELSLSETFQRIRQVLLLPHVQWLVVYLFIHRIGVITTDALAQLKLLEYGMKKEQIATLTTFTAPLNIMIPMVITSMIDKKKTFFYSISSYFPRILLSFVWGVYIYYFMINTDIDSPTSSSLFSTSFILFAILTIFQTILSALQMVCGMSFFSIIADPHIGGTFITLLHTSANLGGSLSRLLVMSLVDWLTFPVCVPAIVNETGTTAGSQWGWAFLTHLFGIANSQEVYTQYQSHGIINSDDIDPAIALANHPYVCAMVDGFYIELFLFGIVGMGLWALFFAKMRHYDTLPVSVWRT